MHFTFVINPTAGKGRSARMSRYLERTVSRWATPARILRPRDSEQTRRMVRDEAGSAESCFVAVGGDGTVSQVAAGIIDAGAESHLGVIPAGSGNDFWRMTGLPSRVPSALEGLKDGQPVACDYGRLLWIDGDVRREAIFINAAGIGLDAAVVEAVRRVPLPGIFGYTVAALVQLARWDAPTVVIEPEGHPRPTGLRLLFAYAGNGAFGGGGFRLAPDASLQDGKLDVCVVDDVSFLRALFLLPRALRGTHVSAPEVRMMRVSALEIRSNKALPLHADGDLLSWTTTSIRIGIVPGGISVLFPPVKKI